MSLLGKSYIWKSNRLKLKYQKYSNIYVLLLIIGAILVFGFTKFITTNPVITSYSSYIGFILWIVAVIFAIAGNRVKNADKKCR